MRDLTLHEIDDQLAEQVPSRELMGSSCCRSSSSGGGLLGRGDGVLDGCGGLLGRGDGVLDRCGGLLGRGDGVLDGCGGLLGRGHGVVDRRCRRPLGRHLVDGPGGRAHRWGPVFATELPTVVARSAACSTTRVPDVRPCAAPDPRRRRSAAVVRSAEPVTPAGRRHGGRGRRRGRRAWRVWPQRGWSARVSPERRAWPALSCERAPASRLLWPVSGASEPRRPRPRLVGPPVDRRGTRQTGLPARNRRSDVGVSARGEGATECAGLKDQRTSSHEGKSDHAKQLSPPAGHPAVALRVPGRIVARNGDLPACRGATLTLKIAAFGPAAGARICTGALYAAGMFTTI
jgi:hypothetical protein